MIGCHYWIYQIQLFGFCFFPFLPCRSLFEEYIAITEEYRNNPSTVARSRERFEQFLRSFGPLLHPNHAAVFNVNTQLINCSDAMQDIDSSVR